MPRTLNEIAAFTFGLYKGKQKIIDDNLYRFKNLEVLDFGCGCGFITKQIASVAKQIDGVEKEPSCLEFAQQINNDENINYYTSIPSKIYDAIIFCDSLEANDNWEEILIQCKSIVKPSGFILATYPDLTCVPSFWYKLKYKLLQVTPSWWAANKLKAFGNGKGLNLGYRKNPVLLGGIRTHFSLFGIGSKGHILDIWQNNEQSA